MVSLQTGLQAPDYYAFPSKDSAGSPCASAKDLSSDGFAAQDNARFNDASGNGQSGEPAVETECKSSLNTGVKPPKRPNLVSMAFWLLILWTIICAMLVLNHWVGYVFLAPVGLICFLSALYHSTSMLHRPSPEERKRARLRAYKAGRRQDILTPGPGAISTVAAVFIVSSCFGFVGVYETQQKFWGGDWLPDFNNVGMTPQFVLWLWFTGFLVAGLFGLVSLAFFGFILGLCRAYRTLKRPEPAKGPPQVPLIIDSERHVIDCVLSLTILSLTYICVIAHDLYESSVVMWISVVGIALCGGWILLQQIRLASQAEQIQLCIDWATDVDFIPVDSHLTEMLARCEMILGKYLISGFLFLPLLIGGRVLSNHIGDKNLGILSSLAVAYFVFLYLGLWAIWRRGSFPSVPRTTQTYG